MASHESLRAEENARTSEKESKKSDDNDRETKSSDNKQESKKAEDKPHDVNQPKLTTVVEYCGQLRLKHFFTRNEANRIKS